MRISYCTWGMPTVPIDTIARAVAETGYDGLEPTVTPGYTLELYSLDRDERQRVLRLIKEYGLDIPAVSGHASLVESDAETHGRHFQRLRDGVDLCAEWTLGERPPALDITAGGAPDQWDAVKPLLVERTAELVEYAASRNVVVAMAPHHRSAITTGEQMLELIEQVNSPFLRVNFDISHFVTHGYGVVEAVDLMAPYIEHVHLRDARGIVPNFEFLVPGEGGIDYVAFLSALHQHGYEGHVTAEVSLMVQERPNYDALAAMKQSYAVVARAFGEARIPRT